MSTLFLRLLSTARRDDEGFHLTGEWLIVEDDGSERATGVTDFRGLSDLIDPAADWLQNPNNIVTIVPGEHVLGVSCEVPGRSTGQIRRALPYVVEEFVAADIEAMHLAHGPIRRGERIRVNLINRVHVEDWLACLAELGITPGLMISEAELLPADATAVSVLFEADSVLIKTDSQAASVDRENLVLALSSVEATRLVLINGELNDLERSQLDADLEIEEVGASGQSNLSYLATRWQTSPDVINLLQGSFEVAQPRGSTFLRWRAVAAVLALWVVVGWITMVAEGFWASSRADDLQAQSEALYRDIFPAEQRIVNVRRQMRQKLGQRTSAGSHGFTSYLASLAQGVDRSVSILSLTYTQTRDELAADLLLRNYDELERLKQRLAQLGVNVEITSAEQQDSGVRARVRLRGSQDV